jgi:hypothetical protein
VTVPRQTGRTGRTEAWSELAQAQAGAVSRRQLRERGLTCGQIDARLESGRWTGLLPGVYATFTGPVPTLTRAWAAVLYAGSGAALGGAAALWLWRPSDRPPDVITVCVPADRRVVGQPGLRVVVRRQLAARVHPVALPARLRVEVAVLDLADEATEPERVVDVLLHATQSRITTPARLVATLSERRRHRWRALVRDVLDDAGQGVQSALERRWLTDVERRHGLPRGERNAADTGDDGRRRYRDVRYRGWRLVVELDGREAHPDWARFRDRSRDNASALGGDVTVRYGWREVAADPCGVAAQLVTVLRLQGWAGTPRRCSPDCPVQPS